MSTTKPTPHASRSSPGSYKPVADGGSCRFSEIRGASPSSKGVRSRVAIALGAPQRGNREELFMHQPDAEVKCNLYIHTISKRHVLAGRAGASAAKRRRRPCEADGAASA